MGNEELDRAFEVLLGGRVFKCDMLDPHTGKECGNTLFESDAYELDYNPGCVVIDCKKCGYGWQIWKLERRWERDNAAHLQAYERRKQE